MYFIDVIRGKNITFVYHKILYNMKEEELIEQMKNGNNIAFAALYDYYCQKVYNFTKLYMVTVDSVEKRTDIDFFPALPDEIENRIEAELVQELP